MKNLFRPNGVVLTIVSGSEKSAPLPRTLWKALRDLEGEARIVEREKTRPQVQTAGEGELLGCGAPSTRASPATRGGCPREAGRSGRESACGPVLSGAPRRRAWHALRRSRAGGPGLERRYVSDIEIVLDAVRRYLESHTAELMERHVREDIEWGLRGRD